jgi:inner membrane protein
VELNGSGSLGFVPLGRHSAVNLRSAWPDPSFTGAYLPERRSISEKGFEAEWNLSHLARSLPQRWCDADGDEDPKCHEFSNCSVGVSLAHSVDSYRTMDRALKHGILFLALVFTAFFVFEMTAARPLSPLHYALVGAALSLFYLALLALSEFIGFDLAYAASAGAATLLITLYSSAILHSGRRALLIFAGLAVVYGYLFFVLQMQDYALLAGTFALFTALAAIMWVTRRIRAAGDTEPGTGSSGTNP